MPPPTPHSASAPSNTALASRALAAGELVLIPTETLYGLAASAASASAIASLREARNRLAGHDFGTAPSTWHAPSVAAVTNTFHFLAPVQRRLLGKLAPGPVTFVIQASQAELAGACDSLGALPGTLYDESAAWVRIPSDPIAQRILAGAALPIVAESIPTQPGSGAPPATDPGQARSAALAAEVRVHMVVDTGPTTLRRPSALVRFTRSGGWELLKPGPFDPDYLKRASERTILFVCTGNTCRSPMAEAIARSVLKTDPGSRVSSAGVGALDGAGLSPEAIKAVRSLGMDPPTGRSRMITGAMIAAADEIYAMTRSHRAAILSIDPSAASKTHLVDPDGRDVLDPIGAGQSRYDAVATELKKMIERRLQEGNS